MSFALDGYNGAILQTLAVWRALDAPSNADMVRDLNQFVKSFQENEDDDDQEELPPTYRVAMERLTKCLEEKDDASALKLGNDVTALHSVPSAIYCALRARDEEGPQQEHSYFERYFVCLSC